MKNSTLSIQLEEKIKSCSKNSFGLDNTTIYRRREFERNGIKSFLKYRVKGLFNRYLIKRKFVKEFSSIMTSLDDKSKELLVELLAYRILGFTKVKLALNNSDYWDNVKRIEAKAEVSTGEATTLFSGLQRFNLNEFGYKITIDYTIDGVMMDFVLEQYAFHQGKTIQAEPGDTVLDLGGCMGDTALYFADKVGEKGKVYSFEFIPRNLKVHKWNVSLNVNLKERIQLVQNPVFNRSDITVYYQDKGPGSKVTMKPFDGMTGSVKTISIDDFVKKNSIGKVDFIKMDIEGAEPFALDGARNTILKFKPKLAIAIYHSINDMALIPNWILNLNLGYTIHLGHYTIHEDETICFASVD